MKSFKIRCLLLCCLCVSALASTPAAAGVAVLSWNIHHFGWKTDIDYKAIAGIMRHFDLIAVQEVMDPYKAGILAHHLQQVTGETWHAVTSRTVGDHGYREGYAFFWNPEAVKYVRYASLYTDPEDAFAHAPYAAVFRDRTTGREFILATVHIAYGTTTARPITEIKALDEYWHWLGSAYSGLPRLLVGDFKFPASHQAFDALDALADNVIDQSTLLPGTLNYETRYDHIWVGPEFKEISGHGVVPLMRWTGRSRGNIARHLSDHLPVFVVLGDRQLDRKP